MLLFFILEISDEDECSSTSDFFFTVHLKIQFSSLIILRFSIFQHKNTFFCGDARHWPFGDPSGTYTSFHFFILQLTFSNLFLLHFHYFPSDSILYISCSFFLSLSFDSFACTFQDTVGMSHPLPPPPPLPLHNFKTLEWNNLHHDIFHLKLGRPRLYSPFGFSRSHSFHIKRWYQIYKIFRKFPVSHDVDVQFYFLV